MTLGALSGLTPVDKSSPTRRASSKKADGRAKDTEVKQIARRLFLSESGKRFLSLDSASQDEFALDRIADPKV